MRMAVTKRQDITNAEKDVEKKESLYIIGEKANWYNCY
jgi:hypothetical protein